MNTIKRLIESCDFIILALLERLRDKRKINVIPESSISRAEVLMEKEKKYKNYIKLYLLLKKVENSSYDGREEYRKNVTMIAHLERRDLEIDVPRLTEYYENIKEFVDTAEEDLT